jgi:hypothetical protein
MIDPALFLKKRQPRGFLRKRAAQPITWPQRPLQAAGKRFTYRDPISNRIETGEIVRLRYDRRNSFDVVLDGLGEPRGVIVYHPMLNIWSAATPRHHGLERRTDTEVAIALLTDPPIY